MSDSPRVRKARQVVPVPTLRVTRGVLAGTVIRLDRDAGTVGRRDDNAYVLVEPRVSRVHARITREAGVVVVTDLNSSAGTWLNGERIEGSAAVHHGDRIGFGPVTATLEDPARAAASGESTDRYEFPDLTGPQLSPRQREVVSLMAAGLTNREIGEELGVTERTVKAYAGDLYDKLEVRNRAGAVAEAARLGLL